MKKLMKENPQKPACRQGRAESLKAHPRRIFADKRGRHQRWRRKNEQIGGL